MRTTRGRVAGKRRLDEGQRGRVEREDGAGLGGARDLQSPIARAAENQLVHYGCCVVGFGWFARKPVICFTA